MILSVNTSQPEVVELLIQDQKKVVATITIPAAHHQAEVLLPTLEKVLKKVKVQLSAIMAIKVVNQGHGFTSLRIGVVTANALAYALHIPIIPSKGRVLRKQNIAIAQPLYDKPPTITKKKLKVTKL